MGIFDPSRTILATGKNVFITGGNCGIGFETAKELAHRGANVTIGCRNKERMQNALQSIRSEIKVSKSSGSVDGVLMDLASFDSVRAASDELEKRLSHIDIAILNAGIMRTPLKLSEGIEMHQKVNHFSHFLLLNRIMDLLEKAEGRPRVISVSSMAHTYGNGKQLYWRKFESEEEYEQEMFSSLMNTYLNYDLIVRRYFSISIFGNRRQNNLADPLTTWEPYGESKLANVCHMHHLAKLKPNIGCFSLHPGVVQTELARDWAKSRPIFFWFAKPLMAMFLKTPVQGAQTSLYCALAAELDEPQFSGKYFSEKGNGWEAVPTKFATDELAHALWKTSEEITK